MEEKYGLITGVECKFVKTDPELIDIINTRTGIDKMRIRRMVRYNIFTVNQFSSLTGLAVSTIRNLIRPCVNDKVSGGWDTKLDYCHPYQSEKEQGPLFILRNVKAEKYLKA